MLNQNLLQIFRQADFWPSQFEIARPLWINGISGSARALLTAALYQEKSEPILFLTSSESEARLILKDLQNLLPEETLSYFPANQLLPYHVLASGRENLTFRLQTLSKSEQALVIVASWEGLLRRLTPPEIFRRSFLTLKIGQQLDPHQLRRQLVNLGYEAVSLVEGKGQFSFRGGIADIFPAESSQAFRVEFFDDEIETIRIFSPDSQLSLTNCSQIRIGPATELVLTPQIRDKGQQALKKAFAEQIERLPKNSEIRLYLEEYQQEVQQQLEENWGAMEQFLPYFYPQSVSLLDYLAPNTLIIIDDPNRIQETSQAIFKERSCIYTDLIEQGKILPGQWQGYWEENELKKCFFSHRLIALSQLPGNQQEFWQRTKQLDFNLKTLPAFMGRIDLLTTNLRHWKKNGFRVILLSSKSSRRQKLIEDLQQENLKIHQNISEIPPQEIARLPGSIFCEGFSLQQGFEFAASKLVIITERELYGQTQHAYRKKTNSPEKMNIFADLREGDFVVHLNHGIGHYLGLKTEEREGIHREYLVLKYAGDDKLYIPTDQAGMLQKYLGSETSAPRLSKLGSTEWLKTRNKVKAAVKEMAKDLLKLYAARETFRGYAFGPDTIWQKEFEDSFIFEETPDQLKAMAEIKADMEKDRPMDRLLCGDVGYGKTEVALRAAFKAVNDGKQVAVLVPTTLLAQQHFLTFGERLQNYPIRLEMLSRFKSPKERRTIIQELARGQIDIVIGTHRLLQEDVKFRNLGLLVVDEEQRFGVAHKEKIKNLQKNVDVLTLTATPIPRTLHMSLVGIRDTSILQTPPDNRFPVQTYVLKEDPILLREAILREIDRNGQIFFMHNRIAELNNIALYLEQLIPGLSWGIAHGQMKEDELEQIMLDFMEGKFSVLICTSIIENGLDIPNVNTLIVRDANNLGLSQLYQLRGRVGRSNRMAYAYFTYRSNKILNELSAKRLSAIREFTEFGSGYKIAMRDLEIRGAGNILGAEQHGHIAAVGFDLYCRLLESAIKDIKGEAQESTMEISIDLPLESYLPARYIPDNQQKIDLYRRIAHLSQDSEIEEIHKEISDRFGAMPASVANLLTIASLKILARKLGVKSITGQNNYLKLVLAEKHKLTGSKMALLAQKYQDNIRFNQQDNDYEIKLKAPHLESKINKYIKVLQELMQTSLEE